jgi:PAS domain S-box-containing protein
VSGDPNIRFYAGSPIEADGGERIGTVCVIDRAPKQLTRSQRQVLEGLARIASLCMADRRRRVGTARALAESEARYRAIVEDQSELISIADPDGTLRFVNTAYAEHFGKAVADLLGHNLLEFVAEADRVPVAEHLVRVAQSAAVQIGVNRMQSAQGATRWVSWVNRPLLGSAGEVVAIQSVGRAITEQSEPEERLRAALAERETLLKEVYHRVKNNLQVVQSLLSLQHRAVIDPQARRALEDTARRVRAMALVHEKLYQTGNLNSVSLREYTTDLLRQIDEATGAARLGIRFEADVLDLHCKSDSAIPFGLILTELVFNAMEHAFVARSSGQVRIELVMHEQVPTLIVSDNGQSLPADFDITTVASMGLQLASTLAEQLGGQLEAGSSQGAWFRIRLPRL